MVYTPLWLSRNVSKNADARPVPAMVVTALPIMLRMMFATICYGGKTNDHHSAALQLLSCVFFQAAAIRTLHLALTSAGSETMGPPRKAAKTKGYHAPDHFGPLPLKRLLRRLKQPEASPSNSSRLVLEHAPLIWHALPFVLIRQPCAIVPRAFPPGAADISCDECLATTKVSRWCPTLSATHLGCCPETQPFAGGIAAKLLNQNYWLRPQRQTPS